MIDGSIVSLFLFFLLSLPSSTVMASPPHSAQLEGMVPLPGRSVSFIQCMSTRCIACGVYLQPDSAFVAVGGPYYGVLHRDCAPHYHYPKMGWPHPKVAIAYSEQ